MASETRPVLSRMEIVIISAAVLVELGWWWSRTKLRIEAAVPWSVRRRLNWRPR
jgi:hypothetical protein